MKIITTNIAKKLPMDIRKAIVKEFKSWNAHITEISRKKAIYELCKPNSERTKVCMFRDDYHVYVYGDYGSFDFDQMTWQATPKNLCYDDISYMFDKMSKRSKQAIKVYNPITACADIRNWLKETLDSFLKDGITKYEWKKIKSYLDNIFDRDPDKIADICPFLNKDACKLVNTAADLTLSAIQGKESLISAIQEYGYMLIDYDQDVFLSLEHVGEEICDNVWISLLALNILGDKMEHMKRGGDNWHVLFRDNA